MSVRQIFRLSVASRETLPLGEQLTHVLEVARQAVAVDRLHLWAVSPEGDRLVYVTGSGVSEEDWNSLEEPVEILVADAGALGNAIRDKRALLVDDPGSRPGLVHRAAKALRATSFVAVPLLARGRTLGLLVADNRYSGTRLVPETLHLLPTFALHIATAVDHAGLLTELQTRDHALSEAREQQTATSEILRIISSSPTDLQTVLDAVAESAARLCDATDVTILRPGADGDALRTVAHYGAIGAPPADEPVPLRRDLISGRVFLDHSTVHVHDVFAESDAEFGGSKAYAARFGHRTYLAVPMLREGKSIGVIAMRRAEVRPFSDQQIELLKTFADQAVIAIENTRLFKDLEERNKSLTEALEQQTAISEILRVISSSPTDLQPVLDAVAQSSARLCAGNDAAIYRVDGDVLRPVAMVGPLGAHPLPLTRETVTGRAVVDRSTVHVEDILTRLDTDFPDARPFQALVGFRTALATPLLREGVSIGAILIRRTEVRPFSDKQIDLLKTFADQAVIAIENTRLFTELQERLEQQTATSEILRVISQSQRDVQPVFEAIAANALKLCQASVGAVTTFDGELMNVAALVGGNPEALEALRRSFPMPPSRGSAVGRAIVSREVVYIRDVREDGEHRLQGADAAGFRSVVSVPMLRDGSPIGAVSVGGADPAMFSERQIAMLETFADQAVIAIENTRLFNELQERNKALVDSLEQQTATSEILRVISGSPTDVQPVFDTIAQSAARLCAAEFCHVFRFDGKLIHFVAQHGLEPEGVEAVRRAYPMAPGRGSATARSIVSGAVEHIPDVHADLDYVHGTLAKIMTFRSIVAVPMLRDGRPIGSIAVARSQTGLFPERQIAMLQTFADQAVIAIENTRLFNELQTRNRDLTEALEQQTATSEILRVISQSQSDVQPVFEAILANTLKLCGANNGNLFTFDGEVMRIGACKSPNAEALEALRQMFPRPIKEEGGVNARAILTRAAVYVPDVRDVPDYPSMALADKWGYRSVLAVPMLREGKPIGTISVNGPEPGMFSDSHIAMLTTFADQAVIAIENVRLFNELKERLEQQTATSEILRVISQSQRDVQPVFETIAANARKLCDATFGQVFTFDGELIHLVAAEGYSPEGLEATQQAYPMRPGRGGAAARAVLTRAVVYIPDVREDAEYRLGTVAQAAGLRSIFSVPMLREGSPIGAISVSGAEPAMFSERQIAMLQTFADQAVIAIENTRLFNKLESRNRDLTEALEQQTATSEILRVISESQRDVQPVFKTIAANARKLCEATFGAVYTFDGELIHFSAADSMSPETVEAIQRAYPMRPSRGGASAPSSPEPSSTYRMFARIRSIPCRAWLGRSNIAASWPSLCSATATQSERSLSAAPNQRCSPNARSPCFRPSPIKR